MKLSELSNRSILLAFFLAAVLIVLTMWIAIPLWTIFAGTNILPFLILPVEVLVLAGLFVVSLGVIILRTTRFSMASLKKPWRRFVWFFLFVVLLIVGNFFLNSFGYLLTSLHELDLDIRVSMYQNAQGMLGLLLFIGIGVSYFVGIYLWHSEVQKPRGRKFLYYTSVSLVGVLVFSLLSNGPLFSALNETFFRWFTAWRGERLSARPAVTLLQFPLGVPAQDRFIRLLAITADLSPSVIAVPGGFSPWDVTAFHEMRKVLPLERFLWNSTYERTDPNLKTADVVSTSDERTRMVYSTDRDFPNDMAWALVEKHFSRKDTHIKRIRMPTTKRGRVLVNHYVVPQSVISGLPFHWLTFIDRGGDEQMIYGSSGGFRVDFKLMKLWKPRFVEKRSATGGAYSEWDFNVDVAQAPKAEIPEVKNNILLLGLYNQPLYQSPEYAIATVVQNIIDGDMLEETSSVENLTFALTFLLILAIVYSLIGRWKAMGLSTVLTVLAIMFLYLVFVRQATVVDPSFVIFGFLFSTVCFFPYEIAIERSRLVEERRRLSSELRTAHDMQMGLMPKEDPVVEGFDISGVCIPASEVGGDFYDYVWLDKKHTRLGIALADVSGKAMKAAMTAVMTSGMIYSETRKSQSPREILARINEPLYLRSDKRVFTALSFAVIDTKRKLLTYSSAGQSHPILLRIGVLSYIKTNGVRLPLGVKEELRYRDVHVRLRKGDTLVFYTDGVPESMNRENALYGFQRFEELLKQDRDIKSQDLRDKIVSDVRAYTKNVEQHDDMTVVVVKVL